MQNISYVGSQTIEPMTNITKYHIGFTPNLTPKEGTRITRSNISGIDTNNIYATVTIDIPSGNSQTKAEEHFPHDIIDYQGSVYRQRPGQYDIGLEIDYYGVLNINNPSDTRKAINDIIERYDGANEKLNEVQDVINSLQEKIVPLRDIVNNHHNIKI